MASNTPDKPSESSTSGTSENIPRGLLGKGGTPITKSTRLPSVRPARDLTLGGAQRKSFKPNIPIRPREKPTGPVEDKLVTKEKRIKKEKTDRPAVGKGRGRGNSSVIQSQSIFESGPTEKTKRDSIYGERGGGDVFRSSTSVNINNVKPTKKETQDVLDQLLRDDFMDDDEDMDISTLPVALPLLNPKKYEEAVKVEVKKVSESKQEIDPTDPCLSASVIDHPEDSLKLVLMQLPDCIPGLLSADDNKPAKVKQEPSTASTSDAQPEKTVEQDLSEKLSTRCKLSDLSEGKIGKLQIMKSGKTRLVLGDLIFDVSRGAPCGFLQELVYVNAGDQTEGHMACLGAVKEKLVVVPNIENLLCT